MKALIVEHTHLAMQTITAALTGTGKVTAEKVTFRDNPLKHADRKFDFIIIENTPGSDEAFHLVREIRHIDIASFMVVVGYNDDEATKLKLINGGADTHFSGTTSIEEMIANLFAMYRRARYTGRLVHLTLGEIALDFIHQTAICENKKLDLTPKEFALLAYMMRRHTELLTRDKIMLDVWGVTGDTGTNIVEVHIRRIREKLGKKHSHRHIKTVYGKGYIFKAT